MTTCENYLNSTDNYFNIASVGNLEGIIPTQSRGFKNADDIRSEGRRLDQNHKSLQIEYLLS